MARRIGCCAFPNVAIEPCLTSPFPVRCIVSVYPGARTRSAEEHVLRWIHHDCHMATPNYEIDRLRICDLLKVTAPGVELGRTRIRVRESRQTINRVHKV
jgi:hypothetical protein